MVSTYQARKLCTIGEGVREPGELVPEAHLWRLVDGMVRSRRLTEVEVEEADFIEAVEQYCPDDAAAIYARVGIEVVEPEGGNGDPVGEQLEDLTVAELKEKAAAEGVDLTGITRKADIIAAIHDSEAAEDTDDDADGDDEEG